MAQVVINTDVKLGEGTLTQDALNGLDTAKSLPIPGNNLNNAMAPGFYHWQTGVTNSPTDWGSMVVTAWDGTGGQTADQLVMKNGSIWSRGKNNNASSWTAWAKIPRAQPYVAKTIGIGASHSIGAASGGVIVYYAMTDPNYLKHFFIPAGVESWFYDTSPVATIYVRVYNNKIEVAAISTGYARVVGYILQN